MLARWVRDRRASDERGFVIVIAAISMFLLVLMVGFGVDIGAWYLRSAHIQRAADAAALAAASKMPDAVAATQVAKETLEKNGFVDGSANIHVTLTPIIPNRYSVTVNDNDVNTYFAKFVLDHISMTRNSQAEYLDSVPLGSPFNVLGTGDLKSPTGGTALNYWLAVNGWCTSKESGDLFLSAWDGNDGNMSRSCPGTETNTDYNPNGYDYIVDVPSAAASSVTVKIYDAAFAPPTTLNSSGNPVPQQGPLKHGSPDGPYVGIYSPSPTIDTTYKLYDTQNTDDTNDDVLLKSETFTTNDPRANAVDGWWALGTVKAPAGQEHKYRVNVTTAQGQANSFGVNAFSLEAERDWATGTACDSRSSTSCPRVYGKTAMSVYANVQKTVDFYLAEIDPGYAGKPLTVSLWDPGEGGKSLQLIDPCGNTVPFYWLASPTDQNYQGAGVTSISVSGTGTQPGLNRLGTAKFNDRRIDISLPIPTDYPACVASAGNDWWKLRYNMPTSGAPPTDRTTWSATISGSDPVHLISGN